MSFFIRSNIFDATEKQNLIKLLSRRVAVYKNGGRCLELVNWPARVVDDGGLLRLPLGVAHVVHKHLTRLQYDGGDRMARIGKFCLRREQEIFLEPLLKEPLFVAAQAWNLQPSFGKTITALYAAAWYGLDTVIVVHRRDLLKMWQCEAAKYNVKVNVVMISQLKKMVVYDGLVIVDEAHASCCKQAVDALIKFMPRLLIGLSGTFYRSDVLAPFVNWFFGPPIELKNQALIEYSSTRSGKIYFEQVETGFVPEKTDNWGALLISLIEIPARNQMIVERVVDLLAAGKKIILFVKNCSHGRILCETLVKKGHDAYCRFAKEDLKSDFDVIVTTYSKMGTGTSDSRINCVVFAIDALQYIVQYVYRGSREKDKDCLLIDFCDDNFVLKKHAKQRRSKYLQFGFVQIG